MDTLENVALVSKEHFKEFAQFHTKANAERSAVPASYAGRPELFTTTQKSIAIIPISGMIGKESYMEYFGGTSLDLLAIRLEKAASDPNVSHIVLNINSPGGYVTAVEQTAALIRAIGERKTVVAHTNSLIASAAYWLASAASKIYTDGKTARIGSIGVYAAMADYTKMLEKAGIEVHEFVTGKYKALGSPYHTPSADEKQKMQDGVDTLFTFFVDTVAEYRGISKDTVAKSADGQVFFAADAEQRKLTDGQLTLMETLTMTEKEQQELATAQAAAKTASDALAASNARILELEASDKANKDLLAKNVAEAATAKAAEVTATCNKAYNEHMGRDATADELAAYTTSNEATQKVILSTLASVSQARGSAANGAALTKEVATKGTDPAADKYDTEASLIVSALAPHQRIAG